MDYISQTSIVSSKTKVSKTAKIGHFSIIEDDVEIHDNVEIGNYCIICKGTIIHKNTIIKNYVEIRENVLIGESCYIDSMVSFSGDSVLGDNVTLRYGVIIARGVIIADKSYLAPRVMTNNLDQELNSVGGAHIGKDCFIGTHSVLQHGIIIGNDVVIGALSFVNKDCLDNRTYFGVPIREKI